MLVCAISGFRHLSQSFRRKWAGRAVEICLTCLFPHSLLLSLTIFFCYEQKNTKMEMQLFCLVCISASELTKFLFKTKLLCFFTPMIITASFLLTVTSHHINIFTCVIFASVKVSLLCFSSVYLNCWWERWTAARCSPCCPLRRAGWVYHQFFFFFFNVKMISNRVRNNVKLCTSFVHLDQLSLSLGWFPLPTFHWMKRKKNPLVDDECWRVLSVMNHLCAV